MRHLDFHPLTDQFPTLAGAAYQAFVDDIEKRGQRRPIALFQGKVWDGRARYNACYDLGIEPTYRPLQNKNRPIEYLIYRSRDQKYGAPKTPERNAALKILQQIYDDEFIAKHKERRRAWLARARAEFKWKVGQVENCAVCEKHAEFAHAHHTLPLNIQFDLGIDEDDIDHSHDWLCPTHHRHVHMMISVFIAETRSGSFLDRIPNHRTEEWLTVERVYERTVALLKKYGSGHGFCRARDFEEQD